MSTPNYRILPPGAGKMVPLTILENFNTIELAQLANFSSESFGQIFADRNPMCLWGVFLHRQEVNGETTTGVNAHPESPKHWSETLHVDLTGDPFAGLSLRRGTDVEGSDCQMHPSRVGTVAHLKGRKPDETIFIGRPEIADLARKCWTSKSGVSQIVTPIFREYRFKENKAISGILGYEIPKEWF